MASGINAEHQIKTKFLIKQIHALNCSCCFAAPCLLDKHCKTAQTGTSPDFLFEISEHASPEAAGRRTNGTINKFKDSNREWQRHE